MAAHREAFDDDRDGDSAAKPVFHILPASLGSGYGMLAIGTS